MQDHSATPVHNPFETEAEMTLMQVTDAQVEVNRFCLNEAAKDKQQYDARLDEMTLESRAAKDYHANQALENAELKRKLQAKEAQKAKNDEREKLLVARINSSNHVARVLKLQLGAALSAAKSDCQGSCRKPIQDESTSAVRVETARNARLLTKKAKVSNTAQLPPKESDTTLDKKRNIVVSCTRCLAHGLHCDNFSTCEECASALKPCKRATCKRFKASGCFNGACTYAHEGDQFENLIPWTRVKPGTPKKGEDQGVRRYTSLFNEIARNNGGEGDDDVAGALSK
ncbi:hypothetical protein G6514_002531 [Epicoccum nigrum]|nr:hypothetical protein G6514_002531 [Epicoccum nigrum]